MLQIRFGPVISWCYPSSIILISQYWLSLESVPLSLLWRGSSLWPSGISGHGAGGLISQCGSNIKSTWVCTVTSQYTTTFDLRCCQDVKPQQADVCPLRSPKMILHLTPAPQYRPPGPVVQSFKSYVKLAFKDGGQTEVGHVVTLNDNVKLTSHNHGRMSWASIPCFGGLWKLNLIGWTLAESS